MAKKSTKSSRSRVDELNDAIEKKKKSAKKPENNPKKSDQNLAMDILPNKSPAEKAVIDADLYETPEQPSEQPDAIEAEKITVTDNTLEDIDLENNETSLDNFATAEPEPIDIDTENAKLTQDIALQDLESSSDLKEATPGKTAGSKKWRIFPRIISIITVGLLAYLGYSIFVANVLPTLYLAALLGVLALYSFFTLFKNFRRKTHSPVIIILLILNLVLSAASGFAIFKINDTLNFFSKTLGVSDKEVSVYHLIVKKDSPKSSIKDLSGSIIHTQRDLTLGNEAIISAVRSQANASVSFSDDLDYLIGLVTEGNDDSAILIHSGTYDGITSENSTFADKTKIIGEIKIETNVEHVEIDNITSKPFAMYLSGIDTRTSTLPTRSLSDVNMVAVINPVERKLLLVSIPRDYYVHIAGTAKGALPDKLTHAGGTGGVQLSMATISELLDIKLEQYARVNFNFVENLVNAIDGINIYNDQNYSFTCWTNHHCKFQPGYNYVYGDCALAFARERHAYETGDRHRGENQQQVIKLVLDKVTSSSTLISKYSDILDSLVGTFETTLTQENITDLVKMHVSDMTPWTVETYNLNGTGGMAPTYTYPNQNLSVMHPDYETVETAKKKIAAALGIEKEESNSESAKTSD